MLLRQILGTDCAIARVLFVSIVRFVKQPCCTAGDTGTHLPKAGRSASDVTPSLALDYFYFIYFSSTDACSAFRKKVSVSCNTPRVCTEKPVGVAPRGRVVMLSLNVPQTPMLKCSNTPFRGGPDHDIKPHASTTETFAIAWLSSASCRCISCWRRN